MNKERGMRMYCFTRYEMKFGDMVIPAKTKCRVINKINTDTVDAPGVQIDVVIYNHNLGNQNIGNDNEVIKHHCNVNNASLDGILISTNTQAVFMDAGDRIYRDKELYKWQIEKIFGKNNIPNSLIVKNEEYGKYAQLGYVIDYLEEEFSEWVAENCEMKEVTEDDIENEYIPDFEVGDRILSCKGLEAFYQKKEEYQKKLEQIGFTYDFRGGLIWG